MPLQKVRVPQTRLRELFNRHYLEDYRRANLTKIITYSGTPDPSTNQPPGTTSEIWELHARNGRYIARVHAYVKPDGTLSASGVPDPKEVIIGNTRYTY